MKFSFNTGRLYTTEGQVITFETFDDCTLFKDHSRLICGEIEGIPGNDEDWRAGYGHWVMRRYDAGMYKMNIDASGLDRCETVHNIKL